MNYRHAFHAGNFADVMKHAVLTLLLAHLRSKPTPFCVLDSHAGTGLTDLTGPEAARTGEFREGVQRLLASDPPEILADYIAALREANPGWPELRAYPGSPMIARFLLRPQDRLVVTELHPEDARTLKRRFYGDRQVAVHEADGYQSLAAFLPPKERRGLVLIDPPYEATDESQRLTAALRRALIRFPTGIYAIWYPIKDVQSATRLCAELAGLGRPGIDARLLRTEIADPERLNGCGMAILNPPWKLEESLNTLLPILRDRMAPRGLWDVGGLAI